MSAPSSAAGGVIDVSGALPSSTVAGGAGVPSYSPPPSGGVGVDTLANTTAAGGASVPSAAGQGLGDWVTNNQYLVGQGIQGLGGALMQSGETSDDKAYELTLQRDREERAAIAANYGTGEAPYGGAAATKQAETPSERWGMSRYRGRYKYDAAKGEVVWVAEGQ
jgi:hypothetical protein